MGEIPEDEDYDPYWDYDNDDPCDHESYDVDILTGRAHCYRCGEAWWLTSDELKEELRLNAALCEAIEDEPA